MLWCPADAPTRVGFAVSRQIRTAVRRNRVRRRLREAYRTARAAAPAATALVILGRPAAAAAPFASLTEELRSALAAIPGARASV